MVAKHSENVWIYLAYSMLTISYLFKNILYIRLTLILASTFFIVFAITFGNVFVDGVVFNGIFIIINATYSYFLIIKYLPIKLTILEERIYKKDFSKVMDRRTFRDFIRKGHLRTFSDGGQVCHHGNNFSGPFYVALINPNYKISCIKKGREIFEIEENSWIGVVEYVMYEKEKKKVNLLNYQQSENPDQKTLLKKKHKIHVKWGLDTVVRERPELQQVEVTDPIFLDEDEPCYVYEFPLGELEKLFLDKDDGVSWKNALYSIWLGYTTKAILRVDAKLMEKDMRKKKLTMIDREKLVEIVEERISFGKSINEEERDDGLPSERKNLLNDNNVNPDVIEIEMNYNNKIDVPKDK